MRIGADRARVRQRRRLWQRCQKRVADLELPDPFDAAAFIRLLAARRGRPIELIPVTARPTLPCGLLITTDRADCIVYLADTTPLHQQHILLHEAAHLLCGHHENAEARLGAARALLPSLSGELVTRVLGRTVYAEPQEQEAELVASLILHRVQRQEPPPPVAPGQLSWTDSVFGLPQSRPGRHV
ncbi:ParH-like protein [Kitasatospora sp. RB6PN24]|uniref:ParH-like protein n=1 Tax=Kitasatospora humi TaxID=2893891 RepID=UPI001E473903|nr:ParH-like protein [Kitasatospora humi]MCC9307138.1 ParH-like protein [Kitasatospora humi]